MTVLVCFTFLLNALVEKATRTFDQRERIELGSPKRCRTNLEGFFRNSIIKFANVHLSVVQGLLREKKSFKNLSTRSLQFSEMSFASCPSLSSSRAIVPRVR